MAFAAEYTPVLPVITASQGRSLAVMSSLDRASGIDNGSGWQSSVSDIEKTTAVLVDLNNKLSREFQSLNTQLSTIQTGITTQQQKNAMLAAAVEDRRKELGSPSDFKVRQTKAQKEVQALQALEASAKARMQSADSRIALRKLKVQELELEKKSLLLDDQARAGSTLKVLEQSVQALKDRVTAQKTQTAYVRLKINELMSVDRPYIKDANRYVNENAALRAELAKVTARKLEVSGKVDAAQQQNDQLALAPEIKHTRELMARRQVLKGRITVAQAKIKALAERDKDVVVTVSEVADQIKSLETENKQLNEILGDTRENIAVLEYRINTLTHYKNRNGQKK